MEFHGQYEYIGADPRLAGHTALGRTVDGVFKVQLDNINHPWAYGWHETPIVDWKLLRKDETRIT